MSGTTPRAAAPALSAVVVTPGGFDQIRATVRALAAQTVVGRIELVIVAPRDGVAEQAAAFGLDRFHSWRVIENGPIDNVDVALAPHLPDVAAELVAPIEDHAFPEPDWAERLLEVYGDGCSGVGAAILNANADSPLSWANHLIAYGQWAETRAEGPHEGPPIHNGAFARKDLEAIRERLPTTWNREGRAIALMKANGATYRFAPRARIRHLSPSTLSSTSSLRVDAGRLYAGNRANAGGWGPLRRLAYAGASPLIPLVRYARLRRELFAGPGAPSERRLGPLLLLGLVFDAAGQALGFATGAGRSRERLATFEMDRVDHLNAADRRRFYPER